MNMPTEGLRVLRAYYRLPPEAGGMEQHIASLSAGQRALGVDVVNVYNVGQPKGPAIRVFPCSDLRAVRPAALRNAVFYIGAVKALGRQPTKKHTVLHVHGDWSDFLYSKLLARSVRADVVAASIHGSCRKDFGRMYRVALSHCALLFAAGKAEVDYLMGVLERHVYHLPSAPKDIFFDAPASERPALHDVISVSNFFPIKRVDVLVECAKLRPNLRFIIFGDGPQRPEIEARLLRERITNLVIAGKKRSHDLAAAFRVARVFLSPSQQEGTPTAALEAMAAGLPVILTPSNDYSWLVQDGQNGFITRGWTADEIVSRIDDCLVDETRRRVMGEANSYVAQGHRWSAKAARVTELMRTRLERVRA